MINALENGLMIQFILKKQSMLVLQLENGWL